MTAILTPLLKHHWGALLSSAAVLLALQLGFLASGLPAALLIIAAWVISIVRVQLPSNPDDLQVAGRQFVALTHELDGAVGELVGQAREELQQADDLVTKAIAELDGSFSAIASQSGQQQQLLLQLREQLSLLTEEQPGCGPALAAILQELQHSNDVLHEQVGLAVRALQFEDLVHQVIQHLGKRVADIGDLTGHLAGQAGSLAEVSSELECGDRLDRLRHNVSVKRQSMQAANHRAVTQSSMDEGDIELF